MLSATCISGAELIYLDSSIWWRKRINIYINNAVITSLNAHRYVHKSTQGSPRPSANSSYSGGGWCYTWGCINGVHEHLQRPAEAKLVRKTSYCRSVGNYQVSVAQEAVHLGMFAVCGQRACVESEIMEHMFWCQSYYLIGCVVFCWTFHWMQLKNSDVFSFHSTLKVAAFDLTKALPWEYVWTQRISKREKKKTLKMYKKHTIQCAVHLLARLLVLHVEENIGLWRLIVWKLWN